MFKLDLVTPEKKVLVDCEVENVTIPGANGQIEVLVGHAPLITTLSEGVLRYKSAEGKTTSVAVSWGYCQVGPTGVKVLAETAESADEIDLERAQLTKKQTLEKLSSGLGSEEIVKYQRKLKRASARIEVAQSK